MFLKNGKQQFCNKAYTYIYFPQEEAGLCRNGRFRSEKATLHQ